MVIVILEDRPIEQSQLWGAVSRARETSRRLRTSGSIAAVAMPATRNWPRSAPKGVARALLTPHPSLVEATTCLLLGALAYLPLDTPAEGVALALLRAGAGNLHIEPETANALLSLMGVAGRGSAPREMELALRLAGRGWSWTAAVGEVGLEPGRAAEVAASVVRDLPRPG